MTPCLCGGPDDGRLSCQGQESEAPYCTAAFANLSLLTAEFFPETYLTPHPGAVSLTGRLGIWAGKATLHKRLEPLLSAVPA